MPTTQELQLPQKGGNAAVIVPGSLVGGEFKLPTTVVKHKFKNLAKGTGFEVPASAAASSSKDTYISYETVDWSTIQFKVQAVTYDGINGSEAVDSSSGSKNSPKITLVSNDIPDNCTDYKALIALLRYWQLNPVFVMLCIGKGIDSSVGYAQIGFAAGIGLMSSAIKASPDGKTGETVTIEITLDAYAIESATQTTMKGTSWIGTVQPYKAASAITFPNILQADLDKMIAGELVILS